MADEQDYIELAEKLGSLRAAAKHLKIPRETFRKRYHRQKETAALSGIGLKVKDAKRAVLEDLEVTGTSRYYSLKDGGVWIKTSKEKQSVAQAMAAIKDGICDDLPKVPDIEAPKNYHTDFATVIPIGDAHIGMFAFGEESGDDFDLEIAVKELCAAFKYLIDQMPSTDKCIIANVGDFLHYHAMEAKTERSGHVLDASGRPQAMVKAGVSVLRYCIEYAAKKHNIVESINVPGNHESLLAHTLNIMLSNIYEGNDRIIIHDEPTSRHYSEFGNNLFGVVHGHQTKDPQLPLLMASEKPEAWGRTKFRTWFRGHHHHDSKVEYNGCFVEQVRTLAASDAYAASGGYLSGRDLKAILYHREFGEVGRTICGIDMLRTVMEKD